MRTLISRITIALCAFLSVLVQQVSEEFSDLWAPGGSKHTIKVARLSPV